MSAQVSERPSGAQPALRAAAGEYPYADTVALARPYAPAAAAVPPAPVFTPLERTPLDVRDPGTHLGAPVARRSTAMTDPVLLDRTAKALRRLPGAHDGKIYAAAVAEHYGTGGHPVQQPQPEPEPEAGPAPGAGEGRVRDVLADALYLAVQWYAGGEEEGDSAKALLYAALHDAVTTAATDTAALDLVRVKVAEGGADLGDITAGALGEIGGAA